LFDNAILDFTRLREAFEDDTAGIVELLEMALDTGARHLAALRDGVAGCAAEVVARAAHSIKGSSSNIGAVRVAHLTEMLEDALRAKNWTEVERLVIDLDAAYEQLREAVANYRAQVAPP